MLQMKYSVQKKGFCHAERSAEERKLSLIHETNPNEDERDILSSNTSLLQKK